MALGPIGVSSIFSVQQRFPASLWGAESRPFSHSDSQPHCSIEMNTEYMRCRGGLPSVRHRKPLSLGGVQGGGGQRRKVRWLNPAPGRRNAHIQVSGRGGLLLREWSGNVSDIKMCTEWFTPEIEIFYMLFQRPLSIFTCGSRSTSCNFLLNLLLPSKLKIRP